MTDEDATPRPRSGHSPERQAPGERVDQDFAMAAQASGNVFGRAWVAEIVAQGLLGVSRFNHFHKELGVSRRILAQRLAELVDEGLMVREKYQARPDRYEYHLTRKGCDLRPVLIAMTRWSEAWRADTPDPSSETTPDRQGSEGL